MAREKLVAMRRAKVMTQEEVAHETGLDRTTISRIERGLTTPGVNACRALARAYEVSFEELWDAIDGDSLRLDRHQVPSWLNHFASLEQGTSQIWSYEPVVVHGLLQTPEYARAVEWADPTPRTDEAIAERVELRMARQRVLTRQPDPLRLRVVLDESVLHRVARSADVMAGQLHHLIEMAQLPNVTIQVLPMASGRFAAGFGAFHVFAKADAPDEPYMACVLDRAGAHYLDRGPDLNAHIALFKHLEEVSLSPAESIELIRRTCKERYE